MASRRKRTIPGILAAAVALTSKTPGAQAYPIKGTGSSICNVSQFDPFTFSFVGSGWTTTRENNTATGMKNWTDLKDDSGSQVVRIQAATTGGHITVALSPAPLGDPAAQGNSRCDGTTGVIELNTNIQDHPNRLLDVARHEMGHMLGLGHTGDGDSFEWDGSAYVNPPTMKTCTDPVAIFTQDDAAALHRKFDDEYIPNGSFEQGSKYWKTNDGSTVQAISNDSVLGQKSLEFTPNDRNSFVVQTVRLAHIVAPAPQIDVDFRSRLVDSSSSGNVTFSIISRAVGYANQLNPSDHCYGQFPDPTTTQHFDYNKVDSVGFFVQDIAGSFAVSSSWADFALPSFLYGNYARDLQIQIRSGVTDSGGAFHPVRFDDVDVLKH